MLPADLIQRFQDRSAKIGIIGIGYVGLPLALTFAGERFQVTGFDVDNIKVSAVNEGRSYLSHIPADVIEAAKAGGHLRATTEFAGLKNMDAIILCVPTPLGPERQPDLKYVTDTAETIAAHLRDGQLVILESTTYPGTSREVMKPILEAGGLKSGVDFLLAYSPEREDPGNAEFRTSLIPKVVGGDGEDALQAACALYDQIVVETIPVSTLEVAEAVKLTENVFRAVNIALANEMKVVYEKMGIDVWEVIDAAKTKPFGYMPFYPGPGLGGHCIPIDPFYLTWRARQVGAETRFIELAGEINTAMPGRVVSVLSENLTEAGKSLDGAAVLCVGLAYKKNVNDIRESPALTLIDMLEDGGANVDYHDPFVPEIPQTREHAALAGRRSVELSADVLRNFDAALIVTDHDAIDFEALVAASKLVIDTRGATRTMTTHRDRIRSA
ncbi:MAG: nucleotide sugar dehydrogenase [Rhodospirillaceae bacterium]|jgi:UDP-N-acetyl-D-glucosamine dehydrogenase|nr:nucleotide sugar dehydrogenase [Rhodospirillaceae bacterium]MBT4114970.1 nucleotide sugar dehydrogenase [Rhodospirillaceae bacterium]MBT4720177.1 nucleotide sugar dehydrogenase [Rhodospirillaceae bacterium]MBT4750788.1 nucleotide sugar dehydrogenase [Rhodospirillaceae bacterium]MBT5177643.1 nucleotide sugar dehydrogenase [Rhodospirillaceae bacterium]